MSVKLTKFVGKNCKKIPCILLLVGKQKIQAYCKVQYHANYVQSPIPENALYWAKFKFIQHVYLEDMVCL